MRLSERELRRIVRSGIAPLLREADFRSVYGEILWGDSRGLPEPDTERERALSMRLRRWFDNEANRLSPEEWEELKRLKGSGEYDDVMSTPPGAAYRSVLMDWRAVASRWGLPESPDREISTETYAGLESVGVWELGPAQVGTNEGVSWSLGWEGQESFMSLAQESREGSSKKCLVVLRARVETNPDSFMFNPNEIKKLKSSIVSGEDEVFQIGGVRTEAGICYRFMEEITRETYYEVMDDFGRLVRSGKF